MEMRRKAAALGLFDGVHAGHRAVISRVLQLSEEKRICPAAFTFKTETVDAKKLGDGYIMHSDRKRRLLYEAGLEYVVMPDFKEMKDMSDVKFVEIVLKDVLLADFVVCGEDFRFGRGARSGVNELKAICAKYGIEVTAASDVTDKNGDKISSENIKKLIASGKIEYANFLMGNNFQIESEVFKGNRIGRTLNFPTVNQHIPKGQVVPLFGVYRTEIEVDGKTYAGITNIGIKPTVQEPPSKPTAETHIPGFDKDIYGKSVTLSLLDFIRPEKKFESFPALADQIRKDIQSIKNVMP